MLIVWFLATLRMFLRSYFDLFFIVKIVSLLQSPDIMDESTFSYLSLLYRVKVSVLVSKTTDWNIDLEMTRGILREEDKELLS
jgi:hypothetical protein